MTTLIADPLVASVPVIETHEPLVDLDGCGIASSGSAAGRLVRRSVAERLVLAQQALPGGVRIVVVEGFRSPEAQQRIFDGYTAGLRAAYPDRDEAELHRLATRYVAPLDVAPHVAGAAVDLLLADAGGRRLWMGTEVDATPEQSDGACMFDAAGIGTEARDNRTMLAEALGAAGLVNYPTEWWHWSFGDRYWAHVTGAAYAFYGPVSA
ncbi:MAG TPA: M15 family metallopeptidase [Jiangellaceae bacterium]